MSRLALSNGLIRSYADAQGWRVPPHGESFLFGIRNGALWPGEANTVEIHPAKPDHWDDCIGIGGPVWHLFPATTDPGLYYTKHPSNPQGAAWLVPGTWRFINGLHHGRPALKQGEPFAVRRDRDRDGRPEYGEAVEVGWFGIDGHSGGHVTLPVGRWSAGCQVLPQPAWTTFWDIVSRREEWLYVLMDGVLLERFALGAPVEG